MTNEQSGCGNSVGMSLWVPPMWSVCGCRCYNPPGGSLSECESIERSGRGSCVFCGLWVPLMWSVCGRGLPWVFRPLADVYCLRVCNMWCGYVMWVRQLSVGVSLVVCGFFWCGQCVGVGYSGRCSPLLVFTGVSEGCVCLISKLGVVALCGCVSCGLCASDVGNMWVWVTVGVVAPCWCLLARLWGMCVSNEQSGRGNSVGVVCGCLWCGGRELPRELQPLVGVYWCVFNDIHYPLMSKRSECGSFLWVCLL